jgi:hypothetical protein
MLIQGLKYDLKKIEVTMSNVHLSVHLLEFLNSLVCDILVCGGVIKFVVKKIRKKRIIQSFPNKFSPC